MVNFPALRPFAGKTRLFLALPALLVGIVLLTGCKKPAVSDPNDPKFVVAEKGDWTITRGQLNQEVDFVLKQNHATREMVGAANVPYVETKVLRSMILRKLILDKAAGMQLPDVDKEAADELKNAQESVPPGHTFDEELQQAGMTLDDLKQRIHDAIVVKKVIETEALKDTTPSEQEIDAFYNDHKDRMQMPATIRASRVLILVSDKDTAADKAAKKKQIDAARARVMKGEDFAKVASEVSQDRSTAPQGGDMGRFPRQHNEAGFDEVAFATKVNTVSPVFLDALGYQFVKVTDSEPAGTVSLADARPYIERGLESKKKQDKANDYTQNLMTNSGVTLHFTMVDPPAQMAPGSGAPGQAPGQGAPDQSQQQAPQASEPPPAAPDQAAPSSSGSTLSSPTLSATNSAPAPSM